VLIVSPRFDDQRKRADIDLLWRVAARTYSPLEPIPVEKQQYLTDDASAIIEIARREGQVISLLSPTCCKGATMKMTQAIKGFLFTLRAEGYSQITIDLYNDVLTTLKGFLKVGYPGRGPEALLYLSAHRLCSRTEERKQRTALRRRRSQSRSVEASRDE
jgi:hypothetical protein